MLLVYSPQSSPRLEYVMKLFFGDLIQTDFRITIDPQEFQSYEGAKLNYSRKKFSSECFVLAADLLFEKEIREQKIPVGEWKGIKTLFAQSALSDLPFDPFAAAFYLVSRYEEYLPFIADDKGRFPEKSGIGFREGFYDIPVVNHYAIFLQELLQRQYPSLIFKTFSYQFQLTYDIDFAFEYRGKGILRNTGGYMKSLMKFDWKEMNSRTRVLFGNAPDPYDTFDYQFALYEKFNLKPIYFFLLGDYNKFDKNISWRNSALHSLIVKIAGKYEVGIHASFASNDQQGILKREINRLSQITGKKIIRNRQHFLKLTFPATYQNLLANGITEDYTMGFASQVGFRAGIAAPFYWYDLSREEITPLLIIPFAVMDASLYYYLKLPAEEAFQKSKDIIDKTKKVNATFQFLAHNDLIAERGAWKNWREKFEALIAYASGV
jgi:hypothetical protein